MNDSNKKIFILEYTIQKLIEQSNLPVGVVYLILKDIFQPIKQLYFQQAEKEFQQQQEEKNSNGSQGQAD